MSGAMQTRLKILLTRTQFKNGMSREEAKKAATTQITEVIFPEYKVPTKELAEAEKHVDLYGEYYVKHVGKKFDVEKFLELYEDVTEDIVPDLISFAYDDNISDETDEITIVLKDSDGKWANTWTPEGGERIRASIIRGTTTWHGKELDCGKFYADALSASGSPRTVTIKGVAVPLNKPIRKKVRSKAWEGVTLKQIAEKIAEQYKIESPIKGPTELNKLLGIDDTPDAFKFDPSYDRLLKAWERRNYVNEFSVVFDVEEGTMPSYDHIEQSAESDLKFLMRLCEEVGYSLKITNDKIFIFDNLYYEKKKPVKTLTLGDSDILDWSFESSNSERYRSVTVMYRRTSYRKKGEAGGLNIDLEKEGTEDSEYNEDLEKVKSSTDSSVLSYTAVDENVPSDGQEFAYKTRVATLAEAKRKATAKLRKLNERGITGSMSVVGDVSLVAGIVIKCVGFGSFDGNFIIEKAEHSYSISGYTTRMELRRVNKEY